jgi:hypothetical protein
MMASWVAALFFLRFWRSTHERLFLFLSLAFWVLSLNWISLAVFPSSTERLHYHYVARLVASGLIIAGIIVKNRGRPKA